jgi:hypothetical protein
MNADKDQFMAFFELSTPRDMLDKAKREYTKLQQRWDIDNVFNFFVTARHIKDYIIETKAVDETLLNDFLAAQDLKDCQYLCDKGKHLRLNNKNFPNHLTTIWDGSINGAPVNAIDINGNSKWVLINGDREVDVKWLAERVLAKWEKFFSEHSL